MRGSRDTPRGAGSRQQLLESRAAVRHAHPHALVQAVGAGRAVRLGAEDDGGEAARGERRERVLE
jgi:hypothetical protein